MRLAVAGTGYQGAVEAYVTGNRLAADRCTVLVGELAGYAGMAGADSTASEFAGSYDLAAGAAVEAVGELTFALAALGHLAAASLHNHAWAETVAGPSTPADRAVGVRPAPPPSSVGEGPSVLPGWARTVLGMLEGVFWPTADTDRLRAAAATWRSAGVGVGLVAAHCSSAVVAWEDEVSPEVPLAVAATVDLRGRAEELADQLAALGSACEAYAEQVDAKRAELLDLLEELAWELGIGAVVAGVVDVLTAGAATPAAGAAGAARVAAASARMRGILDSLGVLTRGTATTLRPITATVRDSRAYLSRLAAARRMEMTERGSVRLSAFLERDPFRKGFLDAHERSVGHTLRDHVGKSIDQLRQRLVDKPSLKMTGTFEDQAHAERWVEAVARKRHSEIQAWLESPKGKRPFTAEFGESTGRVLVRDSGEVVNAVRAKIVLIKDSSMADGWRLLTAYPDL